MNLFGNILIHTFRIFTIFLIFAIVSVFSFSSMEIVKNDYITEKTRLAKNIQTGNGQILDLNTFSFFATANAVEFSPKYLAKIAKEEKIKKEKKEKELAVALKIKKAEAYAKKRASSKNGYYKITGYQAVEAQTDSTPNIAAWNDNIKDAVNVAAVTQNSGFRRGTCLKISGLPETYIVLDHFNKRYNGQKKIDVLVASRSQAHKITGRKKVVVSAPGNCSLKRIVNGKVIYEKLRKKRF